MSKSAFEEANENSDAFKKGIISAVAEKAVGFVLFALTTAFGGTLFLLWNDFIAAFAEHRVSIITSLALIAAVFFTIAWFIRRTVDKRNTDDVKNREEELFTDAAEWKEKARDAIWEKERLQVKCDVLEQELAKTGSSIADDMIQSLSTQKMNIIDAAKFGMTIEQVKSLSEDTRKVLSNMNERACSALRNYCSKCLIILSNNGRRPTWPCNSQGGIPAEFFPAIAIDMSELDLLISTGLVGGSGRISISGSSELHVELGGIEYGIISKSMFTIKTTGERTESAFLYPLTNEGLELASFCGVGTADGFVESAIKYLTSNRMQLIEKPQTQSLQ